MIDWMIIESMINHLLGWDTLTGCCRLLLDLRRCCLLHWLLALLRESPLATYFSPGPVQFEY